MYNRKGMFVLGFIVLGSIVGGYLTTITTTVFLTGAVVGGLLGGLIYFFIDSAVSRWRDWSLPEENIDEQVDDNVFTQSPQARFTQQKELDSMRYHRKWGLWW